MDRDRMQFLADAPPDDHPGEPGFESSSFLTITLVGILAQPWGAVIVTKMRSWSRAVTAMLLPEVVLMPPMFVLVSTGNHALAMLGVAVATIPHCPDHAALAGMLASRFPVHVRCTGLSLCYQLCGTPLSGTAPIIGSSC